jgi:protein-disulfide isomerase
MKSQQLKNILTAFGFFIAVSLGWNAYNTFSKPAVEVDQNAFKSASFDAAIDEGIQRYILAQQEDQQKAQEQQQQAQAERAKNVPPLRDIDHITGNRNADILLIEYSDFECPFCGRFHPTAQEVVDNSGGRVAWVYRHFPLSIHAGAQKKAEASECAAKLGGGDAFWEFSNEMFGENSGIAVEDLSSLAGGLGINATEFQKCIDSGEMASRVAQDLQDGANAGVTGTPGNILLNVQTGETRLIPGAVPTSIVEDAIAELSS